MPASKVTISAKQRVSLIKSRFLKETKSPNGKVLSTSSAKKRKTSAKYNNGGRLHDLLDKAKQLKPAGIYGRIFEGNEQEILFEIAIQANSSPGEKRGAIRATSPEFVEIAQQLYPNAKVGDTYYPVVYKEGGEIEMNERRSEIKGYDVFKKIERNGGYIKTSEVEIDDDYDSDDVEHKRTLAYRVEYRVQWMDLESSSDADTQVFETIDKAYEDAQMPGHWWNGDVDHVKIIQPLFYEVWLNSDDSEYEEVKHFVGEDLLYNREKGSDEAAAQLGLKASDLNEIYVKDFGSRDEDAHELEDEVYDNLGGDLEKSFTASNGQTYKIQHTGNSKYSRLNIVDKDGYIIDSVQLRISNHKYNPANNDRDAKAGKFISVEIANKNPTAARFSTQYSLGFYGRDTYDEVLEKVKERLDDILETLIDYPEHEQTMKHGGNINDHIMTHVAAGGLGEAIGSLAFLEKGGAIEKEKKMAKELNPDDAPVKEYFAHKSGEAGGVLVGKRHSEGGIDAINKATNEPLNMEGGEVVITRNAVSSDQKHNFDGEKLTNKEILSKINESGGGVSFANGGEVQRHGSLKNQFYPERQADTALIEPVKDKYTFDKSMFTVSPETPVLEVGSSIYSKDGSGLKEWIIEHFTDNGIELKHKVSNSLATQSENKFISYDELKKLFAEKEVQLKNVLNDRELDLIVSMIKEHIKNVTEKEKELVMPDYCHLIEEHRKKRIK